MTQENIFDPEMRLIKKDEYYLFYEMMIQSLKTDNVEDGINKSLSLLRVFLQSQNVLLYKKNNDGIYVYKTSDEPMGELTKLISSIVNKTSSLTENKGVFNLDLNISDKLENIILISLKSIDMDYILCINNYNKLKKLEVHFWERLRDTLFIIFKRAASYEKNTKAISTDLLTGLDNRNSYEIRLQNFDESDSNLVFGIFDLFRLKYVNDNYSHAVGDMYIKAVAKILNKYWPKYHVIIRDDGTESYLETGHCIYRIGGDEFVLLTNKENLALTKIKASLAAEEVSMIKLRDDIDLPLGLNFGVVQHQAGDFIKKTYMNADEVMVEDKRKMYSKRGFDRRK